MPDDQSCSPACRAAPHELDGQGEWVTHGILQAHIFNLGIAGLNRNVSDLRARAGIGFSNEEYGYEDRVNRPNTPDNVLRAHWAIILGGGTADYGHSPSRLTGKYMWAGWDSYWKKQGTPSEPPRSVEEVAQGQKAAPWLAKMRDWMNSGRVGYWRMRPSNHLAGGDAQNRFCLAAPGEEYLVSGEDGTIRLDLSAASGRSLSVEEFDPKTGTIRRLGETRGANSYEHAVPPGNFVVLHVGAPPAR